MLSQRTNHRFLPEFPLPDSLELTSVIADAIDTADLAVIVVPVAGLRETYAELLRPEERYR